MTKPDDRVPGRSGAAPAEDIPIDDVRVLVFPTTGKRLTADQIRAVGPEVSRMIVTEPVVVRVKRKDALAFRVAVQANQKLGLETPSWVESAAELVEPATPAPLKNGRVKDIASGKSSVKRGFIARARQRKAAKMKDPSAGAPQDLAPSDQ